MTFEEFMLVMQDIVSTDYSTHSGKMVKMLVKQAWDAATEEVKKDHFKIGEEVDILPDIRARVKAKAKDGTWHTYNPADVRRIPAWEPKDGEAVMFNLNECGVAVVAVYKDDVLYCGRTVYRYCRERVKPFNPDKIGRLWDDI